MGSNMKRVGKLGESDIKLIKYAKIKLKKVAGLFAIMNIKYEVQFLKY